ncbi:MAG: AarF/ABC1/UbiB kinase family protein [Opitutaceae bacterium]|jgi:ubiquinone biosynthesis protein|nr:AarF/ABC1/UbiB kinase family protein [Opitutaceae bacterium]
MKGFNLLSHATRAKEILGVLAKHGYADLINQVDLPESVWQRLPHPGGDLTTPERLRRAAEELGPAFVKLGQFLSMRPDVLPQAVILELRKLQSNVQPLPYEVMKPVLVGALGGDPAEIFEEFNEVPLAAASLAQVYTATLREGNRQKVAIKVLKPDARRTIELDLDFAQWFAEQLHQRAATLKPFNLPAAVAEARQSMLAELDFRLEARNQLFFNHNNPDPAKVFAPAVHERYSSERVLVMDLVTGENVAHCSAPPEVRRDIAGRGAESLVRQVLIDGFFHADPHAGNVLVTPDLRLCFLDWGMVGHLTRRLRFGLAEFWTSAVEQDPERIVQIAASLAPPGVGTPDLRQMEKEVTIALREELNFSVGRQELGRAMIRLLNIFGRHGISLSDDYSMMAKAVLSIEEVGRELDPGFDLREHAKPVLRELFRGETGPRVVIRRLRELLKDTAEGLRSLPGELHRIVRRLERDDFTINFQHRGLEQMDQSLKSAANRVTLGVIIGSLIIGSSMIVTTGIEPHLLGYPALGIVGYLISALLGLYVIWGIIWRDGHR